MFDRFTLTRASAAAGAALTALSLTAFARPAAAESGTDFLREFAKNTIPVRIVYSGSHALAVAQTLEQTIRHNPDYKRGNDGIRTLSLTEAEPIDFRHTTVVLILSREDMGPASSSANRTLPPALLKLLPFDPNELNGFHSISQSAMDSGDPGKPVYRVGIFAPDDARLKRVYDNFTAYRAGSFRDLPFLARYTTNRINIFSAPEYGPILSAAKWGELPERIVWNQVYWHPLADRDRMSDDELAEGSQVYFLDRSQPSSIPSVIKPMLAGQNLTRSTILNLRGGTAAGTGSQSTPPVNASSLALPVPNGGIYVYSAPTRSILEATIHGHPGIRPLLTLPVSVEAADLRSVTNAPLMVTVSSASDSVVAGDQGAILADLLAGDLSALSGIRVTSTGPAAATLARAIESPSLGSDPDSLRGLRAQLNSRYVWLFRVTEYHGSTRYDSTTESLATKPTPFTDTEPTEPSRYRKENDDDFDKRMRQYREDHRRWAWKKRQYQDHWENDPCQWNLKITKHESAQTRGHLQLWDLAGASGTPQPIWETDCAGDTEATGDYRTRQITVAGYETRPDALPAPPALETCGERTLNNSARYALRQAGDRLRETAFLPGDTSSVSLASITNDSPPDLPPAPAGYKVTDGNAAPTTAAAPSALPPGTLTKVADIDGQTITLSGGTAEGIRTGDTLQIVLKSREIRDPDTNALRDIRVLDSLKILVIKSEITADCIPATRADAAKLSQVRTGLLVRRSSNGH